MCVQRDEHYEVNRCGCRLERCASSYMNKSIDMHSHNVDNNLLIAIVNSYFSLNLKYSIIAQLPRAKSSQLGGDAPVRPGRQGASVSNHSELTGEHCAIVFLAIVVHEHGDRDHTAGKVVGVDDRVVR